MRLKKRVQQLEDRIIACERRLFPLTSSTNHSYAASLKPKKSKIKKKKKIGYSSCTSSSSHTGCKICGKPLPPSRTVYCSSKCAKKGHRQIDNQQHKEKYASKKKINKKTWIPSNNEMEMFKNRALTTVQWKKYFGLKTYSGVYKKLGQLAMYKDQ